MAKKMTAKSNPSDRRDNMHPGMGAS